MIETAEAPAPVRYNSQGEPLKVVAEYEKKELPKLVCRSVVKIKYKNWQNEIKDRVVLPAHVWFGKSEFHENRQWFLRAYDDLRGAYRDFALVDVIGWHEMERGDDSQVLDVAKRFVNSECWIIKYQA